MMITEEVIYLRQGMYSRQRMNPSIDNVIVWAMSKSNNFLKNTSKIRLLSPYNIIFTTLLVQVLVG